MGLQSQIGSSKLSRLASTLPIKLGNLEVRLAHGEDEVSQVLKMRSEIFQLPTKINVDEHDAVCDHLIVIDKSPTRSNQTSPIVGTYRLVRAEHAAKVGGFYSASEFKISQMLVGNTDLNFLEFGRSCVLPDYRNMRAIELLWAGSWAYIKKHNIDILFGCASFRGVDPHQHLEALSFLYHFAASDKIFDVKVNPKFRGDLKLLDKVDIDTKRALKNLPPLIKGYLRVGAKFSTEFAIDKKFNTIDVLTVLPVSNIKKRYIKYYSAKDTRS